MDEKVSLILELQQAGLSKDEISERLDYKQVSSLNRYMKNKGYKLVDGIFELDDKTDNINKNLKKQDDKLEKENNEVDLKFSFKNLDSKISKELLIECNNLIQKYSNEKLKLIAMVLLKECIDSMPKQESFKNAGLIKNVRTFFEAAFKNDFEKLITFLEEEGIPFEREKIQSYTSIRVFLKNDESLNDYINSLSQEELENIRKKLSLINPFTENFQNALRNSRKEE